MEVVGVCRHMWAKKEKKKKKGGNVWIKIGIEKLLQIDVPLSPLDSPRIGLIFEQSCETELDMIDLFLTMFCTTPPLQKKYTPFNNVTL